MTFSTMARRLRAGSALPAIALAAIGATGGTFLAAPVSAQDYTQVNATGRVQTADGKAVAGATVEVKSNDQGFTRSVTTDSSGAYRITALPQGNYSFTITASGYSSFTDANVLLTQGNGANNFSLAPAGGAVAASDGKEIVVTGSRVRVADFDRATTGAVINIGELSKRVPVQRDLTSVVLLSPGTTTGDTAFGTSSQGYLPSINGSSVSENVYYINGLNITQFRNGLGAVPVPFDFYQTVDIKNGAIPAEFGRTTGGVINITTKSGSNQFHVSLTANYEPGWGRTHSPNTYNMDNDSQYASRREMIAQVSGPIIKDHLFFYGLYDNRDVKAGGGYTGTSSTTTTGANACSSNPTQCTDFGNLRTANLTLAGTQYLKDVSTSPFYGGKIDAIIVDGQRLEGTYFNTSGFTQRDIFGTSVYSLASGRRYNPNTNNPGGYVSSTIFRSGGVNYAFRYTGTFTKWLTLSANYGVNKNRDTIESSTPNFPSIVDQRGGTNTSIGNATTNANLASDKRTFYRADADIYFSFLGTHHIRGGYDREDLQEGEFIQANGGFQYTLATATGVVDAVTGLPGGTNYAIARTFVSGGNFKTRDQAFYLQDSWKLFNDRLQLNLGIRNDKFDNKNAAGQSFFKVKNQWGPRIQAIFDPIGDGRAKVYGSFSRYFLPVAVNTNVRLAGSELDYDAYYRLNGLNADGTPNLGAAVTTVVGGVPCPAGGPAGNACVVRNDGSIPSTTSTVSSSLKPQSTDEFILGGEYRLGSRIKIGAFLTYSKLNNSLEDASLDQAIVPFCQSQGNTLAACQSLYNGVTQYALINPGRDVTVTLADGLPNNPNYNTPVTFSAASLGYPKAKRTYKAATITFDREFDGKWSLSASYTYSKLRGNIEGGIRSDNGQTDAGLTTAFDLPALVNGSYGYLPNDRRHNIKIYGSYNAFDWLTLGANVSIASPRHFGCIGRVPANADGNLAGRFYGAAGFYCNLDSSGNVVTNPVGFVLVNPTAAGSTTTLQPTPRGKSFASDWLYLVNLDATFRIPSDKVQAYFRVSVLNVLNHKSALDFNEIGTATAGTPNATYGLAQTYQQPRVFRFQFGVGF